MAMIDDYIMVMVPVMMWPPPMSVRPPDVTITTSPQCRNRVVVFVPDQFFNNSLVIFIPGGIPNEVIHTIDDVVLL